MSGTYGQYPVGQLGNSAVPGSGTVTSVALADTSTTPIYTVGGSPITTAGTLTLTLSTQPANQFFAGPTTGASTQPGFRSLVAADIPTGNFVVGGAGVSGLSITGGTNSIIGSVSITQQAASGSTNGYLTGADWTTFNNKQSTLTFGNLTDVGTDGIVITGGTGVVIGSGTSIAQHVADTTHNGYLTSTDWNTFNGKQSSLTFSQSLTNSAGTVTLTNDSASPGNSKFYGTDSGGTRGWYSSASGTVTSVAFSVPATSILGITGTPITTSGTLALTTTGTSGGIPYFSSTSQLTSSGALTASQLVLGGGAGAAPTSLGAGSQYQVLVMGAANPGYGQLNLAQSAAVTGTLPVGNGGTGQASNWTANGAIYASSTTVLASASAGSSGQVLTSNGSGSAPTMQSVQGNSTILKVPTIQKFISTGTTVGYIFTVTSANATAAATYTNNGHTYTVDTTISAGTTLFCTGSSAPTASGTLTRSGGSGDATITFSAAQAYATYTPPSGPAPLYIIVEAVGGGGGGASGGASATVGSAGLATWFGSTLKAGGGGGGGVTSGNPGGSGGSNTLSSGTTLDDVNGVTGGPCASSILSGSVQNGGIGGMTFYGGGGVGGAPAVAGGDGGTNTGGGGGGGGVNAGANSQNGGGGGGGAYFRILLTSPSATSYSVGTGGAKGTTGASNGGTGAAGKIVVTEYYQ